ENHTSTAWVLPSHKCFLTITVFTTHACVKLACFSSNTLCNDFCVFINQYRHLFNLFPYLFGGGNNFGGCFSHRVGADNRQTRVSKHLFTQLFVSTFHAHH